LVYEASATHQEIEHGVFALPDAQEHVVCAFRTIAGLPRDANAGRFIDLRPDGTLDQDAQQRLVDLRNRGPERLSATLLEYVTVWESDGPGAGYLDDLCAGIQARLWALIEAEITVQASGDAVTDEIDTHWTFAGQRISEAGGTDTTEGGAAVVEYVK